MATTTERKAYTARAKVVNQKPTWRDVHLTGLEAPVSVGFHREIAEIYRLPEGSYAETAATYDYLVGAVAGCLTGVLSGMLEARGVATGDGRISAEAAGETEWRDRVLRVAAIRVHYRIDAGGADEELVRRVHDQHVARCSMAQSVADAIEVTTSYEVV
jgi:uncharacterized OsmC-like protein